MPIEIKGLTHTYMSGSANALIAIDNIDLTINEGEFWGIIGHTGSGKSTLLQHIGGIMEPEHGTLVVDGYDFSDKKQRIEGRKHVGLVFQYPEYQLFEETVAKDIAYGPANMRLPADEVSARVHDSMRLVGLDYDKFAEKSPFELSGGEKRRAALAGIIAMKPRYLALDEPMAGLDPSGRRSILETLDSLRRETGCAIIMVSHSMDDVAAYSDHLAVLKNGGIVMTGAPADVFANGEALRGMGLDLPAMCGLAELLRAKGLDVPRVYTIDGMAEFLIGRARR